MTGATGFIGSHLVEALLDRGDGVRCLARDRQRLRWLEGRTGLAIAQGDITDRSSLKRAVRGVNCIYHLAGLTRAVRVQDFFRVNAEGTRNVVEACLEETVPPRLIYLSTLAVLGPRADLSPLREDTPPRPVSSYGWSKLRGEEIVLSARGRLNVTVLRPPVVYGPRDTGLLQYIRWVKRGLLPIPAGPPRALSLIYVNELVRTIITASQGHRPSGDVYHVSDEKALSLQDIGQMVGEIIGVCPRPLRVPVSILIVLAGLSEAWAWATKQPTFFTRGKVREAAGHWMCDSAKARERLAFIPRLSLEEGMALTVQWYRSRGWI